MNAPSEKKGTYEIVNDAKYGQTLKMNITSFKNNTMTDFANVNVLLSFKCYFDDDDTMHLDRYKKDFTNQGGTAYEFDPPRENTYYRIKDGTKELLTSGKWRVQKIGTPDCDWDEEWTFNDDGTMVDVWTEAGKSPETYNGTFEVIQENGKNILYHTLDWGETKPEWWYEYKSYGPNLISVQLKLTKMQNFLQLKTYVLILAMKKKPMMQS